METINYVLDMNNLKEDLKELILSEVGTYSESGLKVQDNGNTVIVNYYIGEDEYRFYGFNRMNNYYIGRVQYIAGFPEDMIIDEFFNFGQEL